MKEKKDRFCIICSVSLKNEHPRRKYCSSYFCQKERNRINCLKYRRAKNVKN